MLEVTTAKVGADSGVVRSNPLNLNENVTCGSDN